VARALRLGTAITLAFILGLGLARRIEQLKAVGDTEPELDVQEFVQIGSQMTRFYAGSHREPLFVLTTKLFTAPFEDKWWAARLQSMVFGTLLIAVTFFVARQAVNPFAGLGAAFLVATNDFMVRNSCRGFRMELYSLLILLYGWALFRRKWLMVDGQWLTDRPSPASHQPSTMNHPPSPPCVPARLSLILVSGLLGGLLCLTRMTSLCIVFVALAGYACQGSWRWPALRARLVAAVASLAVSATLTLPYVVNCGRERGDWLIWINRHAHGWAQREALMVGGRYANGPPSSHLFGSPHVAQAIAQGKEFSLMDYLWRYRRGWDFVRQPADGFVQIFRSIERLYGPGRRLLPFAALGAFILLLSPHRWLVIIPLASLIPIAYIKRFGAEGRFFMHAFPFHAVWTMVGVNLAVAGLAWALWKAGKAWKRESVGA